MIDRSTTHSIFWLQHVDRVTAQKVIAKRIPLSSRRKREIWNRHWKWNTYIKILVLFLLAFLCLITACQKPEDRWLGDGLDSQEWKQFNCSNRISDVEFFWRESLINGPSVCPRGECIEMAEDSVIDRNGWFYLAQIHRGPSGDGILFTAATIDEADQMSTTGGGPSPNGVFFHREESDDLSPSEDISYSDFTYLLSIASSSDTNEDETAFFVVVAVNSLAKTGPFFRLYEMNSNTFDRATLLAQVENRNIVSIAHDQPGNIVVISHHIEAVDAPISSGDSTDYRVAKYDPTGVLLWERELRDNTLPTPAIAFDSENNILLTHDKSDAIDSALERKLRRSFLWLSKLDEAGELLWEQEMDGAAEVTGLAIDQSSSIVLAAANYTYDYKEDRGLIQYRPWIGSFSADGTLQKVYTSDGLYDELSLDSETYWSETLNVQDLVVDRRTGKIFIPITNREPMGADRALIAEWTPSLQLCSIADMREEAPIRLLPWREGALFYNSRYSWGQIDR